MPGFESWENPFTDVKKSDWFYEDVKFVNTKGLMNGTSDTTYGPAEPLTRGQIVTVLWRQAGSPAPKQAAAFTDVKADWYYTDAIAWAAENKIVEGYGSGTFGPEDFVTREQVMTILYRYAEIEVLHVGILPAYKMAIQMVECAYAASLVAAACILCVYDIFCYI